MINPGTKTRRSFRLKRPLNLNSLCVQRLPGGVDYHLLHLIFCFFGMSKGAYLKWWNRYLNIKHGESECQQFTWWGFGGWKNQMKILDLRLCDSWKTKNIFSQMVVKNADLPWYIEFKCLVFLWVRSIFCHEMRWSRSRINQLRIHRFKLKVPQLKKNPLNLMVQSILNVKETNASIRILKLANIRLRSLNFPTKNELKSEPHLKPGFIPQKYWPQTCLFSLEFWGVYPKCHGPAPQKNHGLKSS